MGFIGIYTSVYDYHPQAEGELELREGDLLYLLDTNDGDDWWKAKKKANLDEEDEPEGLVPNNYIEEVGRPRPGCLCLCVISGERNEWDMPLIIHSEGFWNGLSPTFPVLLCCSCQTVMRSQGCIGEHLSHNNTHSCK